MWAHDQTPPIYLALHCAYFWHLYITCCTYSNDMQDSVPYVLSDPLSFMLCTYESTQVDSVWMCCPLCQHDCRLLRAIATFSKLFFRVLAVTGMLVLPRKASSTAGTFLFVCFSGLVLKVGTHQVFFFFLSRQAERKVYVRVSKLFYEECNQDLWFAQFLPFANLLRKSMCVFYAMQTCVGVLPRRQYCKLLSAHLWWLCTDVSLLRIVSRLGFNHAQFLTCAFFCSKWCRDRFGEKLVDSLGFSLSLPLPKACRPSRRYYWHFVFQVGSELVSQSHFSDATQKAHDFVQHSIALVSFAIKVWQNKEQFITK